MNAYALHVGLRPHHADDIAARLDLPADSIGAQPRVYLDGDWEEWGERPDAVLRPTGWAAHPHAVSPAVHVAIMAADLTHALAILAEIVRGNGAALLIPMRYPSQAGTIATVTTWDDWSEEIAVVRASHNWEAEVNR